MRPELYQTQVNEKKDIAMSSTFFKRENATIQNLYEIPLTEGKNTNLNSLQLFQNEEQIILFDNVDDNLVVFDDNFVEKYRLNYKGFPKSEFS